MDKSTDRITKLVLDTINKANRPLETKEVENEVTEILKDATRTKIYYRLNNLRGDGLVNGRYIGPGKGVWIWWRKDAFERR